ncbi:hypothetical protein [Kutzneria chonburiensis]|uniref:Uncharacterized protein n=1 Tax=Kutzneria chonburiensis TaxID=1483604 RepID=A0ABV6MIY3_9PSEU|nr:hypothetical protein [Kutzneria chonburiensis]
MSDNEELLARLRRLEDENRRLSARIDELTAAEPVNQRGMFKRAAVGAAALTVGGIAVAPEAAAAPSSGPPVILGDSNTSTTPTGFTVNGPDSDALTARNDAANTANRLSGAIFGAGVDYGVVGHGHTRAGVIGICPEDYRTVMRVTDPVGVAGIGWSGSSGVYGFSSDKEGVSAQSFGTAGVHGNCQNPAGFGVFGDGAYEAIGVYGHSGNNSGVHGIANEGYGVRGLATTTQGTGVIGIAVQRSGQQVTPAAVTGDADAETGVQGVSNSANGVVGTSLSARGRVFTGGAAQIRLTPGNAATPPAGGQNGDLYVDSTGRLWFYRAGWRNIA